MNQITEVQFKILQLIRHGIFVQDKDFIIRSIDVNSNKDMVLEFNDDVEILDLDSSDFILSNSLDTFRNYRSLPE